MIQLQKLQVVTRPCYNGKNSFVTRFPGPIDCHDVASVVGATLARQSQPRCTHVDQDLRGIPFEEKCQRRSGRDTTTLEQ